MQKLWKILKSGWTWLVLGLSVLLVTSSRKKGGTATQLKSAVDDERADLEATIANLKVREQELETQKAAIARQYAESERRREIIIKEFDRLMAEAKARQATAAGQDFDAQDRANREKWGR